MSHGSKDYAKLEAILHERLAREKEIAESFEMVVWMRQMTP